MKRVLLGLGSNRNYKEMNSEQLLDAACKELKSVLINPVFSSIYISKAMYVTDQNDFYNMTATGYIEDNKSAYELLEDIHRIEAIYGRDRTKEIRFGPRSLDIDIELFGDEEINTADLQIPHVRLQERAFVLIPALEILNESADVKIREKFDHYLGKLKAQNSDLGIELYKKVSIK